MQISTLHVHCSIAVYLQCSYSVRAVYTADTLHVHCTYTDTYFTLFFILILGFFYTYFTPQTNLHIYSNTSLPLILHLIYTYTHTSFTLTSTSTIGSVLKCTTENTLPVLLKTIACRGHFFYTSVTTMKHFTNET